MSKELNKEPVEQAGGDERDLQGAQGERDGWGSLPIVQVPWNVFDRAVMWVEDRRRYGDDGTIVDDWKALKTIQRTSLAQPSPAQPEGAPVIGCLCGMPMTEGHHSPDGCCNLEDFAPQAQAEKAEAERPEVVAWRYGFSGGIVSDKACLDEWKSGGEYQSLMTVAQHERIVKAWIERWKAYIELSAKIAAQRDAALAEVERLTRDRDDCLKAREHYATQLGAALARVAELEKQEPVALANRGIHAFWVKWTEAAAGLYGPGIKLYAHPVAQAQHSVPDELRAICMLVAETGIKYGRGRHRAVAADECRAVVNAVLDADLSVGRACEYAGCCDKAHPGTSLCIAHHSKKAQEKLLAAAPGKEGL
ncbi:hypothetical protein [Pseudomonas aeruginosa]|uniref:hypothetical protein n=1 Tax=Pseudomonas aeruginosa TaxID=287 RepID=UPI000F88BFA4|nr:hypothetical protein [Pseudomonas aeruginosa]NPW01850.1 hypothetical protein [Pseudomonas aeruginosa]RUC33326.1 hypothetical protein IPC1399_04090 [Pseudomonas aeruginosa]RUC37820.1 hypothetical protein IPC1390_16555 [Pseudomonas aeruginosa]